MGTSRSVVLGFRAHTGWAAVVAVAANSGAPQIVDRRRVAYEPKAGRFIYHQAEELDIAQAKKIIMKGREETAAAAGRELRQMIVALEKRSFAVAAAAIPIGTTRLPTDLAAILAAHSRIHAAEGVFYRETLADACAKAGLQVHHPLERDLWTVCAPLFGLSADKLASRVREMGAALGPPWSEDQKLAMLAAWSHAAARKS